MQRIVLFDLDDTLVDRGAGFRVWIQGAPDDRVAADATVPTVAEAVDFLLRSHPHG